MFKRARPYAVAYAILAASMLGYIVSGMVGKVVFLALAAPLAVLRLARSPS